MKAQPFAAVCVALVFVCSSVFAQEGDASPSDQVKPQADATANAAVQADVAAPQPEPASSAQEDGQPVELSTPVVSSGCATCNQQVTLSPIGGGCSGAGCVACEQTTNCPTCEASRPRVLQVLRSRRADDCISCATATPVSTGCATCASSIAPVSYQVPVSSGCSACSGSVSYATPISTGCSSCSASIQPVSYSEPVSIVSPEPCCQTAQADCCPTVATDCCPPQRPRLFSRIGSRLGSRRGNDCCCR